MLISRVSLSDMTNQTVTVHELMDNSPRMVDDVIDLIVSDTIATLVEINDNYSHLRDLFIRPGEDLVYNYQQTTEHLDFFGEYRELRPLVTQVIENIGVDLWNKMWDEDESSALSEVLRCFGHGTSFWDKYSPYTLDLTEVPKLKITLEQPWDIATQILDKIDDAYPEYRQEVEEEDNFIPDADRFDYLVEDEEEVEEDEPDNVTNFRIPEHYLSLIFNGDASGYEEEEIKAWEEFEQQMIANGYTNGHWSYPEDTEAYFSHTNDVHSLGDTVVDLQWVENNEK